MNKLNEDSSDIFVQAKDILEEEANVLAKLVEDKDFSEMDHRVEIAVMREIRRIRGIASVLVQEVQDRTMRDSIMHDIQKGKQ